MSSDGETLTDQQFLVVSVVPIVVVGLFTATRIGASIKQAHKLYIDDCVCESFPTDHGMIVIRVTDVTVLGLGFLVANLIL
jgi:hypothetical protein